MSERIAIWDASLLAPDSTGAVMNDWQSTNTSTNWLRRTTFASGTPSDATVVVHSGRRGVFSDYNHSFVTDTEHDIAGGIHAFVYTYNRPEGPTTLDNTPLRLMMLSLDDQVSVPLLMHGPDTCNPPLIRMCT